MLSARRKKEVESAFLAEVRTPPLGPPPPPGSHTIMIAWILVLGVVSARPLFFLQAFPGLGVLGLGQVARAALHRQLLPRLRGAPASVLIRF